MLEEGEEIKPRLSDAVIVATSASANGNKSSVVTVVIQRLPVSISPNVVPVDEFSRPHQVWTPCMSHSHPRSYATFLFLHYICYPDVSLDNPLEYEI